MYDFTDLVLLVDENPLPNYVVAKYFHQNNKDMQRIWLLFVEETALREGTGKYARNIANVLSKEFGEKPLKIKQMHLDNISQAYSIGREIEKHFSKVDEIEKVHLNYTGGAKEPAIHIYRTLENKFKSQLGRRFTASYLDTQNYNIKFDHNPEQITGDLREMQLVDSEVLFALHDRRMVKAKNNYIHDIEPTQREAIMQSIANLAAKNKLEEFKTWADVASQDNSKRDNALDREKSLLRMPRDHKSEEELKKIIDTRLESFTPSKNPELFNCLASFPEQDRLVDEDGKWIYDNFKISGESKNTDSLEDFLTDKWLESYTAWILENTIEEYGIDSSDIISGYEFNPTSFDKVKEKQFRSERNLRNEKKKPFNKYRPDIIAINGCQICGIACDTTLDKNKLKNRALETILCNNQFGGKESQTMLITLLNPKDAAYLGDEIEVLLDSNKQFMILGVKDLKIEELQEKARQHIYADKWFTKKTKIVDLQKQESDKRLQKLQSMGSTQKSSKRNTINR